MNINWEEIIQGSLAIAALGVIWFLIWLIPILAFQIGG